MATYQEFKNNLIAQLSTSNDAELVSMVEALIDYTDAILDAYVSPGTPPPLPNNSGNSRFVDSSGTPGTPPPLPQPNSSSKIS